MSQHEEFTRNIVQKLEQAAQQHPEQELVLSYVMQAIKPRRVVIKQRTWAMSGFALAAAISGIALLPNLISQQPNAQPNQIAESAKMSPQMIEDLEMLSLFGVESDKYGS